MQAHDHDSEAVDSLRPKGSRIDETDHTNDHASNHANDHAGESAHAAQAAAAGQWEAVGPNGLAHLQRSAGNAAVADALQRSPVHDVVSRSGRPLDPEVREDMESRLGADFGDVRVHDDSAAHDSAKAVNAHAYTVGPNIVFQRDRFDPASAEGKVTLAHELTHVVQQRNGPVEGTPAAGGIKISDPGDRFEREASANAERVMSAPAPAVAPAQPVQRDVDDESGLQRAAEPSIQRESGEEEEEVQGSFVQRHGDEEADVQRAEEEEEVQGSFESQSVQRAGEDEEEIEG